MNCQIITYQIQCQPTLLEPQEHSDGAQVSTEKEGTKLEKIESKNKKGRKDQQRNMKLDLFENIFITCTADKREGENKYIGTTIT